MVPTIEWKDNAVVMIDQRILPAKQEYIVCTDYEQVADAIRTMVIRGAPAIGCAAAMGVAVGVLHANEDNLDAEFNTICDTLAGTRPTAVNLFWAIDRMRKLYDAERAKGVSIGDLRARLIAEGEEVLREDIEINKAIGRHGAALMPDAGNVMTHCNAGALATGGYGTALGVIRGAIESGKPVAVLANETRPFMQGSRLTVWELQQDDISVTLLTDNMAGHTMRAGKVQAVVVGADRIAGNGDVANKIGTYSVAVLAKENGIPFYVAAPISTIDYTLTSGDQIPIEERAAEEVTHVHGTPIAPEGTAVMNPAFDVTPSKYVTAIITQHGVAKAPYTENLRALAEKDK